jgi:hypothetical protein
MAFLEEEENITSLTPSPSPLEERGVYIASFSPKGEGIQG